MISLAVISGLGSLSSVITSPEHQVQNQRVHHQNYDDGYRLLTKAHDTPTTLGVALGVEETILNRGPSGAWAREEQ
jgi:hypothetical protein